MNRNRPNSVRSERCQLLSCLFRLQMLPTKMTEHDDVQTVLKDTIVLLCRNALQFHSQVNVEALLAITVDQNEVLLVSIRETVHADDADGQLNTHYFITVVTVLLYVHIKYLTVDIIERRFKSM